MLDAAREEANDLRSVIVNRMLSQAPGVYILLRSLARRKTKKNLEDIFLRNPRAIYNLLMKYYGDRLTAIFVFRNLFIKPLAEYLRLHDKVDELTKAAIEGCDELLKVINSFNPSVKFDEIGLCAADDGENFRVNGNGRERHVNYSIFPYLTTNMVSGDRHFIPF